ncbi:MAG: hypothetical protein K6C35_00780 [Eubacterium sp.]|nr:hypothetical protein [Eubacterium sp.]
MGKDNKFTVLLRRVKSGSVSKMWNFAKDIHKEKKYPTALIFLDMGFCIFKYGIGYQEYRGYHFEGKNIRLRRTFMTMNHNIALTRELNQEDKYPILKDKTIFMETYKDFVGREFLNLSKCSADEFKSFVGRHDYIICKPADNFGGLGIRKYICSEIEEVDALYKELLENKIYDIEEGIHQHPEMSRLYPGSINTLRMATVRGKNGPQFFYAILRMGVGGSFTDNATSGGIYTYVRRDGLLKFDAYAEKIGVYFDKHPDTGVTFKGYKVPMMKEAIELAIKAAEHVPELGYVGWDIAISDKGPVIVEGNDIPGYDMPQNSAWHKKGNGILPGVEKILGHKCPKL